MTSPTVRWDDVRRRAAFAFELYEAVGDAPGALFAHFVNGIVSLLDARDRAQLGEAETLLARGVLAGLVLRQETVRAVVGPFAFEELAWLGRLAGDREGGPPEREALASESREAADGQAATHLNAALTLSERLGARGGAAIAHLALAQVARVEGDDPSESRHARAALDLYLELEDHRGEARARFALGGIAYREGDDARARTELIAALKLWDFRDLDGGALFPAALARLWLATLLPAAGRLRRRGSGTLDPDVTRRLDMFVDEQLRLQHRPPTRARAVRELESALDCLHVVAEDAGALYVGSGVLSEVAHQLRRRGRAADALLVALAAVRLHGRRRGLPSSEVRRRLAREHRPAYLLALDIAASAHDGHAALEISEATRAVGVAGLVRRQSPIRYGRYDLSGLEPFREMVELFRTIVRLESELVDSDRRLDEAYSRLKELIDQELGPAVLGWPISRGWPQRRGVGDLGSWFDLEVHDLIRGIGEIFRDEERLKAVRGRLAEEISGLFVHELTWPDPARLLEQTEDTHVLMCEVGVVDDQAHLYTIWAAPGKRVEVGRSPLEGEELSGIEAFAAGGRDARLFDTDPRRFERLGALLLPDRLRKLLLARRTAKEPLRLLLSPAGGLWKLPFAALRLGPGSDAPLLVERAVLTYAPSLDAYVAVKRDPLFSRRSGDPAALVYFNPTLQAAGIQRAALTAHFGRLEEVHNAAELLTALAGAENYAICVLGAHGDDRPGLSHSLDLGDGDRLYAGELLLASLPRVVVLGACSSGSLALEPGDEPLGLPTAALAGGARTVLAALFPVPDRETAEILAGTYAGIGHGAEPAAALREAQLAHIAGCAGRDLCPPMHWAGCVAIGRG